MQLPRNCEVVLQLHRHLLPHQLLEIREEQLPNKNRKQMRNKTRVMEFESIQRRKKKDYHFRFFLQRGDASFQREDDYVECMMMFFFFKKDFFKYFYVWFVGSICWCWTLQTVDLVRHLVVGHTNKILTVKMILGLGRHPSKPVVWPVGYDLGRAKSETESIWLKPRKTAIWVLDFIILGLGWVGSENRQSF